RLALAELAHGGGFQHHAQVVETVEQLEVERAHAPAAFRMHLEIAFALEAEQRLAHRRARHPRAARYLVLREARARQQPELEDVALQLAVDRLGEVLHKRKIRCALPPLTLFFVSEGRASTRDRQPGMSPMVCG